MHPRPGPADLPPRRRPLHDDLFRRLVAARDHLHRSVEEGVPLAELARTAGLSRFHFLRLYREAFGATPHEYLTRLRIARAKRLLAGEHGSVTEVCFDLGFSSLGSFSTLFAERVGCPPSVFRRGVWRLGGARRIAAPWCFLSRHAA
jgi:AraC-like DNA-binding protein